MSAVAEPRVTVLLPVLNGAEYLRSSIESILAQTFVDFELLVIDDGSTDATPQILDSIRDRRLRVITHPHNFGFVASIKEGLEKARAPLVARQDHDDFSFPDRLQNQVDYLDAHPACALVGTEAWQTDSHGRRAFRLLRPTGAESVRWYLCFDNAFIHSSVTYRRGLVRACYDDTLPQFPTDDYALWSRVARVHPTGNLPAPLINYREHTTSATGSMSAEKLEIFESATAKIREENLRALFGDGRKMEDAVILSTYRRNFSAETGEAFLDVFERRWRAYQGQSRSNPDLRRTAAAQLAELAYRLLPVSRGRSAQLFLRALRMYPRLLGMLPWARIGALWILGGSARTIYTRLFGPA